MGELQGVSANTSSYNAGLVMRVVGTLMDFYWARHIRRYLFGAKQAFFVYPLGCNCDVDYKVCSRAYFFQDLARLAISREIHQL